MSLCPRRLADTDANGQTRVCVVAARFRQPGGWGSSVSSTNGCAAWHLSLPPSTAVYNPPSPFHPPHHVLFTIFISSVASQHLPLTCVHGSVLPMALVPASLCDVLYPTYEIRLASPPLRFPCVPFCHACLCQLCFSLSIWREKLLCAG